MNEIRVPLPALYVDELRESDAGGAVQVINQIPEGDEAGVPTSASLMFHVVCTVNAALSTTTRIELVRGSTGQYDIVYDGALGGFQAGYSGTMTTRSSVGAAVLDEQLFSITPATPFASLELIEVTVFASHSGDPVTHVASWSFTIADVTAPDIIEVRWLTPTRCVVGFNEVVEAESLEYLYAADGVEVTASAIVLRGQVLTGSYWASMVVGVRGSDKPLNNQDWGITSLTNPASTRVLTVAPTGASLTVDDGLDLDSQGRIVRIRKLRGALSNFQFIPRLSEETAIEVAAVPLIKSISVMDGREIPPGISEGAYILLTLDEDISYGRLYRLSARVEDSLGNVGVSTFGFRTPEFGLNLETDLGYWSDGILAQGDKAEDLENEGILRRISQAFQDLLNMHRYRGKVLGDLHDPYLCPVEALPWLLSHLGNPFHFPLSEEYLMRRTAEYLPELYRKKGTTGGIEGFVEGVLGFDCEVIPFVSYAGWVLNDPVWSTLGSASVLWPGTAYARNCYEIVTYRDLEDWERDALREIAEWSDVMGMHLVEIVEPWMLAAGTAVVPGSSYWILGTSVLGSTTILSP